MNRDVLLSSLLAVMLVVGVDCACRKPNPVTGPPVIIEKRCKLPPKPTLPEPQSHRPTDGGLHCFTSEEANKLRHRDAVLKQWIREVLARCSDTHTEAPDAGSPNATD